MVLGNILVIDPKSTSTKIAVFENSKMSFLTTILQSSLLYPINLPTANRQY
jgi:butyrate kinase